MNSNRCLQSAPLSFLCWLPLGFALIGTDLVAATDAILKGTVLARETSQPIPCTVIITDANGRTVSERDSFRGGFRSPGQFEKRQPAGRTTVRILRGFEVRAVEQTLDLPAGQSTNLTFTLERQVDLRRRGWFAGDSHAHMIHGERTIPVDFDFVALSARAEDLQYFSLAHAWQMDDPTPEKLSAELSKRSTPDCVLSWNLEAPKNYYRGDAGRCLGHCWNVGVQGRTRDGRDVIGLLLEASAWDYESSKPTFANFESHRLIHEQGGVVFYTHPLRWWMGPWGGQGGYPKVDRMRVSNMAVELPLDTLLGPTYDGLDLITTSGELEANAKAFQLWALLLNHGYRLAPTASSDACFDRPGGAVPGAARTYTYLEEPFSLSAVGRATAAGRTFVTTGPLLLATVDGQPPGTAFPTTTGSRTLHVEAWASGQDTNGLQRLEIVKNGEPFRQIAWPRPVSFFATNFALPGNEAGWFCVKVRGRDPRQRAITGAFYFDAVPHQPPAALSAHVALRVLDADSRQPLEATITEVIYAGALPREGKTHRAVAGEARLTVPGIARLRAEAPGHAPLTLSPVLDSLELIDLITRFEEKDLLDWQTFERLRQLLANVRLEFALKRTALR